MEQPHENPTTTGRPTRRAGAGTRRPHGRVRAIARAAGRTCSRPSCDTPAAATLTFSYAEQVARVVDLADQGDPQSYDLCAIHADRTSPPRGWDLADARTARTDTPRRLDDDETVAVLGAALRGETLPTRVSLLEGGRDGDADADVDAASPAAPTSGTAAGPDAQTAPDGGAAPAQDDPDDDPLRAALEELQRVAARDDEPSAPRPAATTTPIRPDAEDDLTLW